MDLDWCSDENPTVFQIFNNDSIISNNIKVNIITDINKTNNAIKNVNYSNKKNDINEINIDDCFNLDLNIDSKKKLLKVINYLSCISNLLRIKIRTRKFSNFEKNKYIDNNEYSNIFKYMLWLRDTCIEITKYFNNSKKQELSSEFNIFKPFKTSSYKFCNYKNSCIVHKNKNKICDKNHFVFDTLIIDINKLLESLKLIDYDNFNWLLNNNSLSIKYDNISKIFVVEKIDNINNIINNENEYFININIVLKSFDVISFVLNKMHDEIHTFLNYDIESCQILI
jgi:hypothetical protein